MAASPISPLSVILFKEYLIKYYLLSVFILMTTPCNGLARYKINKEGLSEGSDEASIAAEGDRRRSVRLYKEFFCWLVDLILKGLARNLSSRLITVQLVFDALVDNSAIRASDLCCLALHHACKVKSIQSINNNLLSRASAAS